MMSQKKPSKLAVIGVTVLVIGVAIAAVVLGAGALTARAANAPQPEAADLTPVTVTPVQFEDHYTTTRRFLGQVEATADAVLSFELAGKLTMLGFDEGQSLRKGDVIARLDTALLLAERDRLSASRAATVAQLTFAQSRLDRATRLQGDGFSSQETLDQARATRDELTSRIAEIDAGLSTVVINLEKSVLTAPFDGRVGAVDVVVAETVNPGQPVLTLIADSNPIARVGIPLHVTAEDLETVQIQIDGQTHAATLRQLRPDIDPVTRTRTALFDLMTDDMPTFGQTVTLHVDTDVPARGTWISLDALQQGSGSIWTVLLVVDGVVRTAAVEVLFQQSNRAFVQASFTEDAQLIATGAHRVVPGQQVRVLEKDG